MTVDPLKVLAAVNDKSPSPNLVKLVAAPLITPSIELSLARFRDNPDKPSNPSAVTLSAIILKLRGVALLMISPLITTGDRLLLIVVS